MTSSYAQVLELILPVLDSLTLLQCSSVCKQINQHITESSTLQLSLRRHLHRLPHKSGQIDSNSADELSELIIKETSIRHVQAKRHTFELPPQSHILTAAKGRIVTFTVPTPEPSDNKWELCKIWTKDGKFNKSVYVDFPPEISMDIPISIEEDVIIVPELMSDGMVAMHVLHLFNDGEWALHHPIQTSEVAHVSQGLGLFSRDPRNGRVWWTRGGMLKIIDWRRGVVLGKLHIPDHAESGLEYRWAGPKLLVGLVTLTHTVHPAVKWIFFVVAVDGMFVRHVASGYMAHVEGHP